LCICLSLTPTGDKHHDPKRTIAFAKEATKSMKTEKDLSDFSRMLKKVTVEAAVGAELD
tara:strand:- start:1030 stop:1206 length:177 start_codon:yes stop_codon:yes gene_type:complete